MKRTTPRARIALGSAVVAVAGFAAAGSLSAAPASAPPSTPPGSSEPAETAGDSSPTALDPARETLVDEIIVSAGDAGFPLDRDCVAGLVAQVPDEELEIVSQQVASEAEVAVATAVTAMPEYAEDTEPGATDGDVVIEPTDTSEDTTGTAPAVDTISPEPALSPETEAIGQQLIGCAHGDADPALVAEALAVIEADPEAPTFDLACVESVLTTFSDETLTLIIEDTDEALPTGSAAGVDVAVETVVPDPAAATDSAPDSASSEPTMTEDTELVDGSLGSIPDEALGEAFMLLACSPELLDELDSAAAELDAISVPDPVTETVTDDTSDDATTESTTG